MAKSVISLCWNMLVFVLSAEGGVSEMRFYFEVARTAFRQIEDVIRRIYEEGLLLFEVELAL